MRRIEAAVAIAALHATWAMAQTPTTSTAPASPSTSVSVAGCLVQEGNRFLLTGVSPTDPRHPSGGANSAKASTPVRYDEGTAEGRGTAGSTSPKGSTPVGTSPSNEGGRRTSGAMSAKGSVPIAPRQSPTYELLAGADQLLREVGHLVEINAVIAPDSSKSEPRKLSVQQLTVRASSCQAMVR